MMKKIMIAVSAVALAAGTLTLPTRADAHVWWFWPAIVAGTVGGLAVGSAAANSQNGYYADGSRGTCHMGREQTPEGNWHRVRVCQY